MFHIEHSGITWMALGIGPGGGVIWPIEELFARKKFKPTVRERIARLNPNGKEEGSLCRGWFIHSAKARAFQYDAKPMREYIQKWGTKTGAHIIYKQGRHRFVTRPSFMEGPRGD